MSDRCNRPFDESLLSGYVDRALTQGDSQRVRVHLEDCASCRALVADIENLREVTMTTQFTVPQDDQWDERPRGVASRSAFALGWLVLAVWLVGVIGFAVGQAWTGSETLVEKLLVFGGVSGVALLFLSVLIDRLRRRKTDRYRGVKK